MNFGLDENTIKYINDIFKKYPQIDKAIIYGSRATGTSRYNSDIDLVLIGDLNWDFSGHIHEELDSLPTPYLFDVRDYSNIENPELKSEIEQQGKLLYQRV